MKEKYLQIIFLTKDCIQKIYFKNLKKLTVRKNLIKENEQKPEDTVHQR